MNNAKILSIAAVTIVVLIGGYYLLGSNNVQAPAGVPTATQGNVVTYSDAGFSPAAISVRSGDTVTFRNVGTGSFWVASNPHPTHTDLPGFDAKKAIGAGDSYSYTFTQSGTWGYHNHFNQSESGSVVVQ